MSDTVTLAEVLPSESDLRFVGSLLACSPDSFEENRSTYWRVFTNGANRAALAGYPHKTWDYVHAEVRRMVSPK